MKRSELRKIIREVIKEQTSVFGPNYIAICVNIPAGGEPYNLDFQLAGCTEGPGVANIFPDEYILGSYQAMSQCLGNCVPINLDLTNNPNLDASDYAYQEPIQCIHLPADNVTPNDYGYDVTGCVGAGAYDTPAYGSGQYIIGTYNNMEICETSCVAPPTPIEPVIPAGLPIGNKKRKRK